MTLADLQTLLDYHYWARDRVLEAVTRLTSEEYGRELGSSFPSIHRTMVHVYSAEWAWCERWTGHSPSAALPPEDYPDPATLQAAWLALEERTRTVLTGLGEEGVERRFTYRNLSGQEHTSVFAEMLQHVVNHGSYHRGQVTTMLRQIGAAPAASMDLITFYRERQG